MRKFTIFITVLGLMLGFAFAPIPTQRVMAATLYVDDDATPPGSGTPGEPYPTIQQGIDKANSGDTVRVAAGTYTENISMKSGVEILGAGAGVTTIDGDSKGSVVYAENVNSAAKLDGFTITNGAGTTVGYYNTYGGGIYLYYSNPMISNCTISNNDADYGGGICLRWSPAIISQNKIIGNQASKHGGGIYAYSSNSIITSNTIMNNGLNWATERGGGIYCDYGSPDMVNNLVTGNGASSGGGVCLYHGSADIISCTITDNEGATDAGGLHVMDAYDKEVTNCIIWGNDYPEVTGSVSITYSCIRYGWIGTGNIDTNPDWVTGSQGDYYLSPTSDCVDSGSDLSSNICFTTEGGTRCMAQLTTRADGTRDTGKVDMGFHYGQYLPGIILGLGTPGGNGYMEVVDVTPPYAHLDWLKVPWPAYSAAAGGTHPCLCNLDKDPYPELVVGLDSYPAAGGYVEIRDDYTTGYAHLTWIRVPWPAYNSANGATYPTCGDFNGDGRNELAIGLGTYSATGGYVEIRGDYTTDYAHKDWVRVPWPAYNSANGATYPAAGDFDGDGKDELAIGLGAYPAAGGYVEVREDASYGFEHKRWVRVPWPAYNSANGATYPAAGDFNGGGADELAIGLGAYPATGGYVDIRDDAMRGHNHLTWVRVPWPAYNSANGATYPACEDVDGDGKDELAIGLGTHPTTGGYVEIKDDRVMGFAHIGWPRVHWPAYNSANGETRPGLKP